MERVLAGLVQVSERLGVPGPIDQALQVVTDLSLDLLGATHASIRVVDAAALLRSVARSGAGSNDAAQIFKKGEGLIGWAVQHARPVRVPDSSLDARFARRPDRSFEACSVMSVPLVAGERVLGAFSVSSPSFDAFSAEHEQIGVVVAHAVSQALRCAELERMATTDALTRAYNHSYLVPALCNEMNRARRNEGSMSVLLMDLDEFKSVNDAHGHAVGDQVLCRFVDAVRGCVRSMDLIIRRGGEEFELIMPDTGTVEGYRVAERIRERLASAPLVVRDNLVVRQTASIGLATWDGNETPAALDQRADKAMYEAKRRGRNQTVIAAMPRVTTTAAAERADPPPGA
ncbi:MAG: sensor domain-containing diguanylate cyclase [Nannocystaceae bacterium]|nr:sensor domain-containing diguanylate cyclase [Nannocystaceae bacterium]